MKRKQEEDKFIPLTFFEIIRYFIEYSDKQQCKEIAKTLHPDKPSRPLQEESTYPSIQKKCRTLEKMGVLQRESIGSSSKGPPTWFYQLKNDMDLNFFKEIAKYYLDENSEYYKDRLLFLESGFVQQYITGDFIKKICKEKKIEITDIYSESILPSILSCFPSSLFLTLFYEDEYFVKLEAEGKKLGKILKNKKVYKFFTFLKLSIYNDLWRGEYLQQNNWTQIEFEPLFKIYFEYQKDFNDLTTKELKTICKNNGITIKNLNKKEIIEALEKKLHTTKIEEKSETSISLPGSYLKKFK